MGDVKILRVRKDELPMPLVVEDANGRGVVLSLEPAGAKRLGARIGKANAETVRHVMEGRAQDRK